MALELAKCIKRKLNVADFQFKNKGKIYTECKYIELRSKGREM